MTYTAHDWNHNTVAEPETLRRQLEEMDAQLEAGGVTLAGTAGEMRSDAEVGLTAGAGGTHTVSVLIASPPSWLDSSGNILEAGLYNSFISIARNAAPTTASKYLMYAGPFGSRQIVPVDSLRVGTVHLQETISLVAADLPYLLDSIITLEADASATFLVLSGVDKLI